MRAAADMLTMVVMAWLSYHLVRLWWKQNRRRVRGLWKQARERLPRKWRPKSPADCPLCQQGVRLDPVWVAPAVQPWSDVKSPRGRKKQYSTQGYACPMGECRYYGITEERIHALVRHTTRGKDHDIIYLECQCCGKVFTSRKNTPLYQIKSEEEQVALALHLLVEGLDISATARVTGKQEATIARWLKRMGQHSQGVHDRVFRELSLPLVQLDELYVRVRDWLKAGWLWLTIDPVSKVIPVLHLGGRKKEDAYAVGHELKARLMPGCVPGFTADGLIAYFHALTAHFGRWMRPPRARVDHWEPDPNFRLGQLVKHKERRRLKYAIRRMAWGKRSALFAVLQANGFRQIIQTAYIERVNLTFRQSVAGLARQTWSLTSESTLRLHLEWFRLYYHFTRPHESLRQPVPGLRGRYRQRTPAMALGLTDRVLTIHDLLHLPLVRPAA